MRSLILLCSVVCWIKVGSQVCLCSVRAVWAACDLVVSIQVYHIAGNKGGIHAVVHAVALLVDHSASTLSCGSGDYADRLRSTGELQRESECRTIAVTDCKTAEMNELAGKLSATMATPLRKIEEFDSNNKEWCQYQEQLEHFFMANEIKEEAKKRSVFLALIGANVYKLL